MEVPQACREPGRESGCPRARWSGGGRAPRFPQPRAIESSSPRARCGCCWRCRHCPWPPTPWARCGELALAATFALTPVEPGGGRVRASWPVLVAGEVATGFSWVAAAGDSRCRSWSAECAWRRLVRAAAAVDTPPPEWPGARGGRDVLARLADTVDEPYPAGTYTVRTPGRLHLYFPGPGGPRAAKNHRHAGLADYPQSIFETAALSLLG